MSGVLAGILCATCWAMGSVMMRDLSRKLDPFTVNAPRTLVGGLAMLIATFATGRDAGYAAITMPQLGLMLGSMLLGGGVGDTLYVASIRRIGVSRAFPISCIYPAITLGLGMIFLNEPVTLKLVGGMILALVGVVLISLRPGRGQAPEEGATSGVTAAVASAAVWAVANILMAPGVAGHDAVMVASIRITALSAALWIVVAIRGTAHTLRCLTTKDWIMVVIGGLIGWGVGSVFFVQSVELLGASRASIITSTSPLFALPLSLIFLKERPTWLVPIGTVLTVVGIALVS